MERPTGSGEPVNFTLYCGIIDERRGVERLDTGINHQ